MVILLDSSELLSDADFKEQKSSVTDLLLYFQLNRVKGALAGLVFYGSGAKPDTLPLSESYYAVKERVEFAEKGRGGLQLAEGFAAAQTLLTGWSGRKDAPKTALVILEGRPDSVTKSVSKAIELKNMGVRVVVAVVGKCIVNKEALEQIVSEPPEDNLLRFKSHQELRSNIGLTAVKLCPTLKSAPGEVLPLRYLPTPILGPV